MPEIGSQGGRIRETDSRKGGGSMEIYISGERADIEKYLNEDFFPVVYQRRMETENHYFRITENSGEYKKSRKGKTYNTRKIRGYFPGEYYETDIYAGKYQAIKPEQLQQLQRDPSADDLHQDPEPGAAAAGYLEFVFRGGISEIERFLNEVFFPVFYEKRHFIITENDGGYMQSRTAQCYKTRKIKGYFP